MDGWMKASVIWKPQNLEKKFSQMSKKETANLSSVYNTGQSEAVILCLVTIKQLNPKDEISKVTALVGRRTWLSTKEH